jgi:hypothetical protein
MGESGAGLSDLLDDYAERNTALFLFLGLLARSEKLTRTLEADAVGAASMPAASTTKLDYLLLGLIALADKTLATADHVKEDIVASSRAPTERPSDLLR